MSSSDVHYLLHQAGLRATAPRQVVVCRSCGRTEDVDCAVNPRPRLAPSSDHSYLLDEAEVVFWGHCPR